MKTIRMLIATLIITTWSVAIFAQEYDDESIKKHPGYIDFEEIEIPGDAGEVTDISLGPALLRIMSGFKMDEEDGEVKDFSGFLSLRVKTFEVHQRDVENILPTMEKIEKQLNKDQWERLVRIKREDEYSIISIKQIKEKIVGLLIMSMEDRVASFVNIVGDINLDKIGDMGLGLSDSTMKNLRMHWD